MHSSLVVSTQIHYRIAGVKKAQALDDTEHRMIPFTEKFRSISEAVKQFGRI